MPIQEIIKSKKLRLYKGNGIWERLSFWHKAVDCEMENGNNLEEEIRGIKDYKNNLLVYNEDFGYYQGYINGEWKDVVDVRPTVYLIKDGEINWSCMDGFDQRGKYLYITVEKNTDSNAIIISPDVSDKMDDPDLPDVLTINGVLETFNMINLTPFKYVHLNCELSGLENTNHEHDDNYNKSFYERAKIVLTKKTETIAKNGSIFNNSELYELESKTFSYELIDFYDLKSLLSESDDVVLDISDIVGEYSIGFAYEYNKYFEPDLPTIIIKDMWLER